MSKTYQIFANNDKHSILQGLTTNNLNLLKNSTLAAQHAAFLGISGRIQYDAIILKPLM